MLLYMKEMESKFTLLAFFNGHWPLLYSFNKMSFVEHFVNIFFACTFCSLKVALSMISASHCLMFLMGFQILERSASIPCVIFSVLCCTCPWSIQISYQWLCLLLFSVHKCSFAFCLCPLYVKPNVYLCLDSWGPDCEQQSVNRL
jgi:hypothetical protein